ncbi:MAG: hypothetical protein EA379_05030 [Phycisphaerales bacterium]|nr:MAG: hypothetical protein EA379_05030 [Phycisphaerales bacterium]
MSNPALEIDVTHRLVAAIAEELWRACGGNDELNWLEAEQHLMAIAQRMDAADAPTARGASSDWPVADRPRIPSKRLDRLEASPARRRSEHVGAQMKHQLPRASAVA